MVLKLYGASNSLMGGGKAAVALTLIEKEIPFEFISVDLDAGEHKTPEFHVLNPFGLVPVIVDDDGFIVYEGRAICKYLEEKYAGQGTSLLPKDLNDRTKVEQAIFAETTTFFPSAIKAGAEALKPSRGLPIEQAVLHENLKKISDCLDAYEIILARHRFLAGDDFTLADLFHYYVVQFLELASIDIVKDKGPNVTRWWNELLSRPSWIKLIGDGLAGTAWRDLNH
ncbi:glutathione S-transferase [Favolaschia claudopus]|uniref:glutathione transferase n=1 Tax=Favolaschia claudopus TaxID=2862362 RepID=A0AAW0E1M2_9AGAR